MSPKAKSLLAREGFFYLCGPNFKRYYLEMKFFLFLFLLTPKAFADGGLELATYSCNYTRAAGGIWSFDSISSTPYTTKLGWYQSAVISKFKYNGGESTDFAVCSYLSSKAPEFLQLNIYFFKGKNLQPMGNDCVFGGRNIEVTFVQRDLWKKEEFLYQTQLIKMGGKEVEFMHIVGTYAPTEVDPLGQCKKAFKQIVPIN